MPKHNWIVFSLNSRVTTNRLLDVRTRPVSQKRRQPLHSWVANTDRWIGKGEGLGPIYRHFDLSVGAREEGVGIWDITPLPLLLYHPQPPSEVGPRAVEQKHVILCGTSVTLPLAYALKTPGFLNALNATICAIKIWIKRLYSGWELNRLCAGVGAREF